MITKILRLFVNTLTAEGKYSGLNRENLMQPSQMHFTQKQKTFSPYSFEFLKSGSNFEHLQNEMTFIADAFPQLRAPKDVVR